MIVKRLGNHTRDDILHYFSQKPDPKPSTSRPVALKAWMWPGESEVSGSEGSKPYLGYVVGLRLSIRVYTV